MLIAAVQLKAVPGNLDSNLASHAHWASRAADAGADMVLFPELSLTGYEPWLAEALQMQSDDHRFDELAGIAISRKLTVAAGFPLAHKTKPRISQLLLFPDGSRSVYSKQMLHAAEEPFFSAGDVPCGFEMQGRVLATGICFETLQREHWRQAADLGASVYLAAVAKHEVGVSAAHEHFSAAAKEFGMTAILVNAIGPADAFVCAGRSAAWADEGDLLAATGSSCEGMLLVDTEAQTARVVEA